MAKWSNDYPGQSGHIHMSLYDKASGNSAFYAEGEPKNMSEIQRHFVAGQQKLMPEFIAFYAQTVNAYSRLVPWLLGPHRCNLGSGKPNHSPASYSGQCQISKS